MVPDWRAWHEEYDDPRSSLSRRRTTVQHELADALHGMTADGVGRPSLISMCAGDGGDVLPVLAANERTAAATLVELDPDLATRARTDAAQRELDVDVRTMDAGDLASYRGCAPAHVLLACGVFGNISEDDVVRTVAALPSLLAERGVVIWTRGHRGSLGDDPSEWVRSVFADHGFDEVSFVRPEDASYRVGVARLRIAPAPRADQGRLFTFVR